MLLALGGAAPVLAQGQTATPEARAALQRGVAAYQAKDLASARAEFETGCNGQDAQSCAYLGTMLRFGQGGAKDEPRARTAYDAACRANIAGACSDLGTMQLFGLGGAKDEPGARASFTKACDVNLARACTLLGQMLTGGQGGPMDRPSAAVLFRKACEANDGPGCGMIYTLSQSERYADRAQRANITPVEGEAARLKACSLGAKNYCNMSSPLSGRP